MRRKYTDEEIENGLDLLAELIDRYGEIYWPIFERLERELSARQDKARKLRARLLPRAASTNAPQLISAQKPVNQVIQRQQADNESNYDGKRRFWRAFYGNCLLYTSPSPRD